MNWTEIVDNVIKFWQFLITQALKYIINFILILVAFYFYQQNEDNEDKIDQYLNDQKLTDKDCAGKEAQCEKRLSMQAESYTRVHNELRDRMETESRERIKTWQNRFDSQQAEMQSTRMKQDVLDDRLNKISKQ